MKYFTDRMIRVVFVSIFMLFATNYAIGQTSIAFTDVQSIDEGDEESGSDETTGSNSNNGSSGNNGGTGGTGGGTGGGGKTLSTETFDVIDFDLDGSLFTEAVQSQVLIAGSFETTWGGQLVFGEQLAQRSLTNLNGGGPVGVLAKLDEDGRQIWRLATDALRPDGVFEQPGGDIYVSGVHRDTKQGFLLKLDADGETQWLRYLGRNGVCNVTAMVPLEYGRVLVSGSFSPWDASEIEGFAKPGAKQIFSLVFDDIGRLESFQSNRRP